MLQQILNSARLLEKAIEASWKRQEVIADNIANADTPGFKKSRVEFESLLKSAIERGAVGGKKTRPEHFDTGWGGDLENTPVAIVKSGNTSMRADGNNVDIDIEMTELAKNTIYYNTLITKLNKELGRLKMAINGGR